MRSVQACRDRGTWFDGTNLNQGGSYFYEGGRGALSPASWPRLNIIKS